MRYRFWNQMMRSNLKYNIDEATVPNSQSGAIPMSQNRGDADINVKVGSQVFFCHRNILSSNSMYFEILFNGNFREADDDGIILPTEYVDVRSFSKLLDAMYGKPFEIGDDLPSMIVTCSYLALTDFADECERYALQNLEKIDLPKLISVPQLRAEYRSLYVRVKKYVCRNFARIYPTMMEIRFELVEELLEYEELLIFGRDHAMKFSQLWLNQRTENEKSWGVCILTAVGVTKTSRRREYEKEVCRLLKPFREYREDWVLDHCERYMQKNFNAEDVAELFLTLRLREDVGLLYVLAKKYVCSLRVHDMSVLSSTLRSRLDEELLYLMMKEYFQYTYSETACKLSNETSAYRRYVPWLTGSLFIATVLVLSPLFSFYCKYRFPNSNNIKTTVH